jgi:hypothetical protein
MKTKNLFNLIKWFCRKLTFNELSSAIVILLEVQSGFRRDIELKPESKPPHFREFKLILFHLWSLLHSGFKNLTGANFRDKIRFQQ